MAAEPERSAFARSLLLYVQNMRKEEAEADSRFHREVMVQAGRTLLSASNKLDQYQAIGYDFNEFVRKLGDEHKSESKFRRVFDQLQPFVLGLSQYVMVADTLVQAGPDLACILYGGAKLLLLVRRPF